MATLIRVKRALEENPVESLLVTFKRRRIDGDSPDDADNGELVKHSVLKFAGTLNSRDGEISRHILDSAALKANFKKHDVEIVEKLRSRTKSQSKSSRLKAVSEHRGVHANNKSPEEKCPESSPLQESLSSDGAGQLNGELAGEAKKLYKLFDILDDEDVDGELPSSMEDKLHQSDSETITCNGVPLTRTKTNALDKPNLQFVYDVYFPLNDVDPTQWEDLVDLQPLENELVFDKYRENGNVASDEEADDCDEDSNDEGNWRNDYPDSDPDSSCGHSYSDDFGCNDLERRLHRFGLEDSDFNLSSDNDSLCTGEIGDIDHRLQADGFEKYKLQICKELGITLSEDNSARAVGEPLSSPAEGCSSGT